MGLDLKEIANYSYIEKGQEIFATQLSHPTDDYHMEIPHGKVAEILWGVWKNYMIWFVDESMEVGIKATDILVREVPVSFELKTCIIAKDNKDVRYTLLNHKQKKTYICANSIRLVTSVKDIELIT